MPRSADISSRVAAVPELVCHSDEVAADEVMPNAPRKVVTESIKQTAL